MCCLHSALKQHVLAISVIKKQRNVVSALTVTNTCVPHVVVWDISEGLVQCTHTYKLWYWP